MATLGSTGKADPQQFDRKRKLFLVDTLIPELCLQLIMMELRLRIFPLNLVKKFSEVWLWQILTAMAGMIL